MTERLPWLLCGEASQVAAAMHGTDRGARWILAGAGAVLRPRSMQASGDLNVYWRHRMQMKRARNHEVLQANGELPTLTRSPRSSGRKRKGTHLKVVK